MSANAIDFGRLFVPEEMTQLYYAPIYSALTALQALRYNQLYAAHINEQFSYFERELGNAISEALLPVLARHGNKDLVERVRQMMQEETDHQSMFEELNQRAFPHLYRGSPHYFIRPSAPARIATACLTRFPGRLLFLLWVALFFEEFSACLSATLVRTEKLDGMLERNFVDVHRRHLADEARHVSLYPHLIRAVHGVAPGILHRVNGQLLKWVMSEILAPKRSGIGVVLRLVNEFPELEPRESTLCASIRGLKDSPAFFDALFGPERLPVMYAMFREYPDFAWHGYRD